MKPLEGKHIIGFIYGTELYGSERGNLAALQSMQRSGAKITVGVSSRTERGGGEVGAYAREMGFDTIEVPFGGPLSGPSMRMFKSYRKRQFKKLHTVSRDILPQLKQLNPSHILIGSPLAHIYLALALFRLNKPIIYRMGDAPGLDSKIQPYLWKALAIRSKTIVANSHFVRSLVKQQGRRLDRKCTVIHNIAPNRPEPVDDSLSNRLRSEKRRNQFVYVGQLTERKGVHELLKALVALDDPQIGCWLVGGVVHDPESIARMRAEIEATRTKTRIDFRGFQPDPRPYFAAADWHVAPSTYDEPFANVTLEAKMGSTASIVSNRGGFPEAIEHGVDGFIIEPEASEIAKTILKVQKLDVTTMGRAAFESTQTTFSKTRFDKAWSHVILEPR